MYVPFGWVADRLRQAAKRSRHRPCKGSQQIGRIGGGGGGVVSGPLARVQVEALRVEQRPGAIVQLSGLAVVREVLPNDVGRIARCDEKTAGNEPGLLPIGQLLGDLAALQGAGKGTAAMRCSDRG